MTGAVFDVAVVGAGPAGATAAYLTANAGLSTVLLERRSIIGIPVRCAEAIFRVKLPDFISPRPEWIARSVETLRLVAPDRSFTDFNLKEDGRTVLVLDRGVFDRHLVELAAAAGAKVRIGSRVTGLLRNCKAVSGVQVVSRGCTEHIQARIVIAADGVESQVARWAGLQTGLDASGICACAQYTLCGVSQNTPKYLHLYLGRSLAPGGYAWAFPKQGDIWNVGLGIRPSFVKTQGQTAQSLLDSFVEERFAEATRVGFVVGAVPVDGRDVKAYGEGIMVVGDAAHQANPLHGGGIINGIKGAIIASETAIEAFSAGDFSSYILRRYQSRCQALFWKRFEHLVRIRQGMDILDDMAFNRVVRILGESASGSLFDFVRTAIRHDPGLLAEFAKLAVYGYR
ncbi:MAG: NAD(P)/FAD-dependent oxidoreductase [Thermodesulfobacteriota bacterium]